MTTTHSNHAKLKIAVLGFKGTGKSAITVRYLTKRFISEYNSKIDFLYTHAWNVEPGVDVDVEVYDTCHCDNADYLLEYIRWANAFVVVYAIDEYRSFHYARQLMKTIAVLKASENCPTIILANKADGLESAYNSRSGSSSSNGHPTITTSHMSDGCGVLTGRQVSSNAGFDLAKEYSSQFQEVSAAESCLEITIAFQNLFEESREFLLEEHWNIQTRTKPRPMTKRMTKMLNSVFAKVTNKKANKQKSLSI